jgi:cellulose synthase/poly-beta-1,6-N-acetylglucosamine synthase-like glycosyltransferase
MSAVGVAAGGIAAAAGVMVAAPCLYLDVLALAALRYRPLTPAPDEETAAAPRLVVLIPAHDEEALVPACVRSLLDQTYRRDRYEVVVVADNCSDRTAEVAALAGARVLLRIDTERRGKGAALRWAIDRLLGEPRPPDAIVVVDADSTADRGFLAALARPFRHGARVVQGESLLDDDGSPRSALRAAAFLLVNRARPAGRSVLGLPCHLAGNGMLLARDVLSAQPWSAYTSAEDLEYALDLRRAGITVAYAGGAILRSPGPPNAEAAERQRLRWEGGKLHLARTRLPALLAGAVRERRPLLLDAAMDLAVPPLALLASATAGGLVVVGLLVATTAVPSWSLAPWIVAATAVPAFVLVGLRAADAPPSAYLALAHAPGFVAGKVRRTRSLLRFRAETWVRTQRAHEQDG